MPRQQEFDEFVVARSPRLLRVAFLLTRDWVAAEDLLQTALSKAWFVWSRIEPNPEPYVRKIIANTYVSWWRRRWNVEEPIAELPERTAVASDQFAAVDVRDELWQSLGRLPKRQRLVLVLRYFEDLSEAETAEVMGCSVGTVKSQASRALAKLRLDESLGVIA
ncbi:RNA polymerase sigma-70 factor, sigma-E family [Micromonospora echinaurantiaca]|uniref:RNA polymerase sigma-70 factor, sigma-E family n=1 Tax=Micromonospora echinaurantiaca TaxID=47857 RepID=A0A1C5K486_9ACTN|nr:SigE family RNA polymerase sigma factor [Micromonospora echinaurantiaca]SCG77580.1 RNA polymerase sigma-70 factor, sigma-E family [Micromonospora echinaurantiaca]